MLHYNVRLKADPLNSDEVVGYLRHIFSCQTDKFKVNVGFSIMLVNSETGSPRYFHVGNNTLNQLYPESRTINNKQDEEDLLETVTTMDLIDHFLQRRATTKETFRRALSLHVKLFPLPAHTLVGADKPNLPDHLLKSKNVATLLRDENYKPYRYNDCIFRCIVYHKNGCVIPKQSQQKIDVLKNLYVKEFQPENFDGRVSLNEFTQVESLFQIRISVYNRKVWKTEKKKDMFAGKPLRLTPLRTAPGGHMSLDLTADHFSYIKSIPTYAHSWVCEICNKYLTKRKQNYNKHRKVCKGEVLARRPRYPKVCRVVPKLTVFDKLEKRGIPVDRSQRFAKYLSCFDLETVPFETDTSDPSNTTTTTYRNKQVAFAASISSNIPGHEGPIVILKPEADQRQLVRELVDCFLTQSEAAGKLEKERMKAILEQLETKIALHYEQADVHSKIKTISGYHTKQADELSLLRDQLLRQITCLPTFSYNGAFFDQRLIESDVVEELYERGIEVDRVVHQAGGYILLSCPQFAMRDWSRYQSPGTSLAAFYRSEGFECGKLAYPFGSFHSLENLKSTVFPPRDTFVSLLKPEGISREEYDRVKQYYNDNCTSMQQYMEHYVAEDTRTFVLCIVKSLEFYHSKKCCPIWEALSIPAVAMNLAVQSMDPNEIVFLPDKNGSELTEVLKGGILGGVAEIWTRLHMAGVTRIRGDGELCRKIEGLDANALYLGKRFCTMSECDIRTHTIFRFNAYSTNGTASTMEMECRYRTIPQDEHSSWRYVKVRVGVRHVHGFEAGSSPSGFHSPWRGTGEPWRKQASSRSCAQSRAKGLQFPGLFCARTRRLQNVERQVGVKRLGIAETERTPRSDRLADINRLGAQSDVELPMGPRETEARSHGVSNEISIVTL